MAILVEIVLNGFIDYSMVFDAISALTLFSLPASFVILTGVSLRLRSERRAATIILVHHASGVTLTPREAGRFIDAVRAIELHFHGRDVRDAPPIGLVPLQGRPGSCIRVHYSSEYGYSAVIEPMTPRKEA